MSYRNNQNLRQNSVPGREGGVFISNWLLMIIMMRPATATCTIYEAIHSNAIQLNWIALRTWDITFIITIIIIIIDFCFRKEKREIEINTSTGNSIEYRHGYAPKDSDIQWKAVKTDGCNIVVTICLWKQIWYREVDHWS